MKPAWLFAPSVASLMFALRTTLAAVLALAIAFWMELGEPQWAAMTVWIVAQNSRGESISKGRWRVIGTFVGAAMAVGLIAAFPSGAMVVFARFVALGRALRDTGDADA